MNYRQHTFAVGVKEGGVHCDVVWRQVVVAQCWPSLHFLVHHLESHAADKMRIATLGRKHTTAAADKLTAFVLLMVAGCSNWATFFHVMWLRMRTWHERNKGKSLTKCTNLFGTLRFTLPTDQDIATIFLFKLYTYGVVLQVQKFLIVPKWKTKIKKEKRNTQ